MFFTQYSGQWIYRKLKLVCIGRDLIIINIFYSHFYLFYVYLFLYFSCAYSCMKKYYWIKEGGVTGSSLLLYFFNILNWRRLFENKFFIHSDSNKFTNFFNLFPPCSHNLSPFLAMKNNAIHLLYIFFLSQMKSLNFEVSC